MFLIFLMLINPEPGEFRTKISSIESEIKAYTLLERNKNHGSTQEEFVATAYRIEFQPPQNCIIEENQKRITTTLLNAIRSGGKIYWNCGKIEILYSKNNV